MSGDHSYATLRCVRQDLASEMLNCCAEGFEEPARMDFVLMLLPRSEVVPLVKGFAPLVECVG